MFNKFDVDHQSTISYEELKPLFLHLNIILKDETLNDYIKYVLKSNGDNKYNGKDASQAFSTLNYNQFQSVYKSILCHQSEYFRAIYNNKEKEIDFGLLGMIETIKIIFKVLMIAV